MMYSIQLIRVVEKDIKKLDAQVRKKIRDCFFQIASDPFVGKKLSGNLSSLWSYHFKHGKVEYRIIYEIFQEEIVVRVVLVGTRENIYKEVVKRI